MENRKLAYQVFQQALLDCINESALIEKKETLNDWSWYYQTLSRGHHSRIHKCLHHLNVLGYQWDLRDARKTFLYGIINRLIPYYCTPMWCHTITFRKPIQKSAYRRKMSHNPKQRTPKYTKDNKSWRKENKSAWKGLCKKWRNKKDRLHTRKLLKEGKADDLPNKTRRDPSYWDWY